MARSVTPPALSEKNRSFAPAIVRYGHRRKSARSVSGRSSSLELSPEIPELQEIESDSTRENHSVRALSSYEARGRSLVRISTTKRKAASTSRHTVVSDSEGPDELALPDPEAARSRPLRELNTVPSPERLSRPPVAHEKATTSHHVSQNPVPDQPSSSKAQAKPRRISQPVAAMKLARTINVAYGHLPITGHKPAVSGTTRDEKAPERPSGASEAKSRTRPGSSTHEAGADVIQSSPDLSPVRHASTWLNAPKPGLDETGRPLAGGKRYFIGIPPPRFEPVAKKAKVTATPRAKKDAPISSYAARLLSSAHRAAASSSKTPVRLPTEEDAIESSSEDEVASLVLPFPAVTPRKPVLKPAAAQHHSKSAKKTSRIEDNGDIPMQELVTSSRSAQPVLQTKNKVVIDVPRSRLSGYTLSAAGPSTSMGKGKDKANAKAPAILPSDEEEEFSEDELLRAEVVRDVSPVPPAQARNTSSSRGPRPQLGHTLTPKKPRPSTTTAEKKRPPRVSDAARTTVLGKRKALDDTPSPDPRPDVVLNTGWYLDADTMQWKRRPQNAVPSSIIESSKVVAAASSKVVAEGLAVVPKRAPVVVEVAVPSKPIFRKRSSLPSALAKHAAATTQASSAAPTATNTRPEQWVRRNIHPSIMDAAPSNGQSTMVDVAYSTAKALPNNPAGQSRVQETDGPVAPHKSNDDIPKDISKPLPAARQAVQSSPQPSADPPPTDVEDTRPTKRPRARPRKQPVVEPQSQPAEDSAPVVKRPRGRPRKVAPEVVQGVTQPFSQAFVQASTGSSTGPSTPAPTPTNTALKQHQTVVEIRRRNSNPAPSQHAPPATSNGVQSHGGEARPLLAEGSAPMVKRPRGRPRKVAPEVALAITQPTFPHALPHASGSSAGPSTPTPSSTTVSLKQHQTVVDVRHRHPAPIQHAPSATTSAEQCISGEVVAPQPLPTEDSAPVVKRRRDRGRKVAPELALAITQPTFSHTSLRASDGPSTGPSTPAAPFTSASLKQHQNVIDFRYPDPAPTQHARAPPPEDLNAPVPEYQRREYFCTALREALTSFASNGAGRGMLFGGKFCELVDPTVYPEEFLRSVVMHTMKDAGLACGQVEIPTEPTYSAVHSRVLTLPCACSPSPYRQCGGVVRFTVDGVSGRIHGVHGLSVTLHIWH